MLDLVSYRSANHISSGIIRHYVVTFVCLHFCLTGYQSAQFIRRALHYASGSRKFFRQSALDKIWIHISFTSRTFLCLFEELLKSPQPDQEENDFLFFNKKNGSIKEATHTHTYKYIYIYIFIYEELILIYIYIYIRISSSWDPKSCPFCLKSFSLLLKSPQPD